ncbi:oxidoreductase [Massariosphaeria phaeospora]|uniref:Oxidoreductase n=1 Tax=Massariosphaeria phaeospora TaxID=100035 RepID=A0A7C8M5Z9_9PLEO|nr:oxidoreductase [Massariosphaeria phaeospora]
MASSFRTDGVALVTGAAGGVGLGIANALAEAGARAIIFADINEYRIWDAAQNSRVFATNPDYRVHACHIDVTDPISVRAVVELATGEFGWLDYLVKSAGVDTERYTAIPENDMEDYDRVQGVNARGMLLCTRAAIAVMEKQEPRSFTSKAGKTKDLGRGVIVNVTSVLSYTAVHEKVAYIASKHAAMGITKSTAHDSFKKGIRVNAICPGYVRTPMLNAETEKVPSTPDIIKAIAPNGRPAEPEEIGESVVYLCCPAASYVDGIGLIVDAGMTMTAHLCV